MSYCKKCSMPIKWIKSPRKKWIPCDPEEITAEGGETLVLRDGNVKKIADPGDKGYIAHWSTCEFADHFRTRKDENE